MNKKGNVGALVMLFFAIMVLAGVGFFGAIFTALFQTSTEVIIPEISGLGAIDNNTNFTEISDVVLSPVENVSSSMTWLGGVLYFLVIITFLGISFTVRMTDSKWLIPLFILFSILALVVGILISNAYEDFYNGGDDLANKLQSQTLLSWMVIYNPLITLILIFVCGFIMFTGAGGQYNEP